MKTTLPVAPPPPARRHHQMQVEPVVFAVLLTLMTLGINIAAPKFETHDASTTARPTQVASTR